MATSLAAAMELAFNFEVQLVEGHEGIYEVTVDGKTVYSNFSQCKPGAPTTEQIVEQVGKFIGVKPKPVTLSDSTDQQAPACSLTDQNSNEDSITSHSNISATEPSSGCGCNPDNVSNSANTSCCSPKDSNSSKTSCC